MEVIRKKICLEDGRSRKQGLLPYIPYNVDVSEKECPFVIPDTSSVDGNWGGFAANIHTQSGKPIIYLEMSYKYNKLMDILRYGIKVKRIRKNGVDNFMRYYDGNIDLYDFKPVDYRNFEKKTDNIFVLADGVEPITDVYLILLEDFDTFEKYDDSSYTFCKYFESLIGKLKIPSSIKGDKVPDFIQYCDISEYLDWMYKYRDVTDCCANDLWERKGGEAMITFLENNRDAYETMLNNVKNYVFDRNGKYYKDCIPTIDINLLLTQDTQAEGLLSPYIEEGIDYTYSALTAFDRDSSGLTTESKLITLRSEERYYDDEGNELPGVYQKFNRVDNGITYTSAMYYFNPYAGEDGEWVESSDETYPSEYDTVDIAAAIPKDADKDSEILVRYRNSEDYPMLIPYKVNVPKNASHVCNENTGEWVTKTERIDGRTVTEYLMEGDFIKEIDIDTSMGTIEFTYVIGGRYYAIERGTISPYYELYSVVENTGIVYNEMYKYNPKAKKSFYFNGAGYVDVYYQEIDFEDAKTMVTSDDFGLSRYCNLSSVLEYDKMADFVAREGDIDILYSTSEQPAIESPLYSLDYIMSLISYNINQENKVATVKRYNADTKELTTNDDVVYKREEKLDLTITGNKVYAFSIKGMISNSIKTPVFKPEYLVGITYEVKSKVDVTVSRGTACAFESHFKLSECNTLEDLENYGNNYFNL